MYTTIRNGAAICLLIAAAIGTWYLSRPVVAPDEDAGAGRTMPLGYYLRDAVLLGTDDDGRIVYKVSADFAEERPDGTSLRLQGVRVEFQRDETDVPWHARSATATADPKQDYFELEGDVRLERPGDDRRAAALVETNRLRLEPQQGTAVADGEVQFTVGGNTLYATGLKASLRDDRLELESDVHGRFAP